MARQSLQPVYVYHEMAKCEAQRGRAVAHDLFEVLSALVLLSSVKHGEVSSASGETVPEAEERLSKSDFPA